MPLPRYVVLILVFWLGTTAWLFQRDLWPRLRPGEPPPFSIDLADEARTGASFENRWTLYIDKDGRRENKGYATTGVKYHREDDTYDLTGKYKMWSGNDRREDADQEIESVYRVTRDGDLRGVTAT